MQIFFSCQFRQRMHSFYKRMYLDGDYYLLKYLLFSSWIDTWGKLHLGFHRNFSFLHFYYIRVKLAWPLKSNKTSVIKVIMKQLHASSEFYHLGRSRDEKKELILRINLELILKSEKLLIYYTNRINNNKINGSE